jgi:hypothetical protein
MMVMMMVMMVVVVMEFYIYIKEGLEAGLCCGCQLKSEIFRGMFLNEMHMTCSRTSASIEKMMERAVRPSWVTLRKLDTFFGVTSITLRPLPSAMSSMFKFLCFLRH